MRVSNWIEAVDELWRRFGKVIILQAMFDQVEESPHRRQSEDRPFTYLHGDVTKGCIILCDHASNALPSAYGLLGLSKGELARHIAYDIGAAGVARELSQLMDAPAVMANFSRLLIDPNRGEDDPTLVMQLSDGVVVPGNANIDMAEVEFRKAHFYEPYHNAIDSLIDEAIGTQVPPVLVSIHSFTERFKGECGHGTRAFCGIRTTVFPSH